MHTTCAFCDRRVQVNPIYDTSICQCGQELSNGLHKKFRKALEKRHYWMKRPKSVMARAASYSNRIYKLASEGESPKLAEVEDRILHRFGAGASANRAECVATSGRSVVDMSDTAVGVMIVEVDGTTGGNLWHHVYVVFRGSAGGHSTFDSGWDENGEHNLDWAVNFENDQKQTSWGPAGAKVHQGCDHMYNTMRTFVHARVGESVRTRPRGTSCIVVVTGHSLGGGLSQLCAHDLQITKPCGPHSPRGLRLTSPKPESARPSQGRLAQAGAAPPGPLPFPEIN